MRKLCLPILAFLLCLACEKQPGEKLFRMVAGVPEDGVKTVLGPKGENARYPVYWQAGDAISVNGTVSRPLSGAEAGGSSATFTFDQTPAEAAVYNVIYPATTALDRVVFPASQTYTEGSFAQGAAPLAGHTLSPESGVRLSTPAAIVRFVFQGDVVLTDMEIVSLGGEKISGEFMLGKDADGAFDGSLSASSSAAESMDFSFGSGLQLCGDGIPVVFTLPHGTYSRGLRAVVREKGGTAMTLRFFASGAEIPAARVCTFPAIAFEAGKEILLAGAEPFEGEDTDVEETAGNEGMDAEDAAAAVSITVGTYNVWAPSARKDYWDPESSKYDQEMSEQRKWSNSYESVAAMINALDCDVIGIQEVTKMVYQTTLTSGNADYDGNVHTLNSLLPNYAWVIYNASNTSYDNLTKNTTANGLGSTDAILYKPSVFTLVSKGRAWLTGTRNVAPGDSETWDRIGTNRPATWAKFTHKASGKQFVFITTHLDLPNAGTDDDPAMPQRRNITELLDWFAPKYAPESLPSVIVGDMNVDTGDTAGNYALLVSDRWKDVYDTMKDDGSLDFNYLRLPGTMNANKNEKGGVSSWRPDHVLCYGFIPSWYKVCTEKLATKDGSLHWPSDHFPIKTVLNF